jgi:ATP-binding cassette subfamily B protein
MQYFPRVLRYLRPYKGLAGVMVVLMAVGAGLTLLAPWPLKILFDSVIGTHPMPPWLATLLGPMVRDRIRLLVLIVIAGFVIVVVQNAVTVLDTFVKAKIEQNIILNFRGDLFQHAQSLSLSYHDERRSGMLVYSINFHADSAAQTIMIIPPLAQSVLTLVGMVWITFWIDAELALLSLIIIPLLYYSVGYYINHIQDRLWEVKMMEGESLSIIHEALQMMRVIVAFTREPFEFGRFRAQGERAIDARIRLTIRQTLFSLAVNTITAVGTAVVLGFGGYAVVRQRLTGGDLLVVLSYIALIYGPLETISTTIGGLQDHFISLRVSFQLMDTVPEIQDRPDAVAVPRLRGDVTFEAVSFHYRERAETLRNISFVAKAGQVVGIVGPTGAGKTTLVSLIPRFYAAQHGRILIDGMDQRTITLASLRQQVGVVLQDPLLSSDSIADNIRYGRLDATMDEVMAAARAADAHEFIAALPEGYDTPIGERGAQLSGGERQRIAIARAFLKDAPILILDEPTSAVDARTEATIFAALERLMAGRTTFIITHRLPSVRHADTILVVDRGELVERGTHAELLARDGLYRRMYTAQMEPRERNPPSLGTGSSRPVDTPSPVPLDSAVDAVGAEVAAPPVESIESRGGVPLIARPKIVLLGMMSKIPVPGVIWQTIHYLVGFQRLGYDAYYVEAHARTPSMLMEREDDDSSARAAAFIDGIMRRFDLGNRWAFQALHDNGRCYGLTEVQLHALYSAAAAIINLHGGTEPRPEHYATDRLVYLETDPVALQLELFRGEQASIDFLAPHCAFFTFAENLGNADCALPVSERFDFRPTRQPVVTDFWTPYRRGPGQTFTTIGNWAQPWRDVEFRGEVYHWSKHHEFLKFLDLPARTAQPFELALSSYSEADKALLESRGWRVRHALDFALDLDGYRDYIARSRGEFTVAKDQNVRFRSGWFSDRSATYLAAGRPVITQETGFSNCLPTGKGLFAFSAIEEIEDALARINAGYDEHSAAAASIAREHFGHDVVLPQMLAEIGVASATRHRRSGGSMACASRDGQPDAPVPMPPAHAAAPEMALSPSLVLEPRARRPIRFPDATARALEELPVPAMRRGYDIVWCPSAGEAACHIRALLDEFAAHGHRVFIVTVDASLATAADLRADATSPNLFAVRVPSPTDDVDTSGMHAEVLETMRGRYGIRAALLWADVDTWGRAMRNARECWGWRTLAERPWDGRILGGSFDRLETLPWLDFSIHLDDDTPPNDTEKARRICLRRSETPSQQRAKVNAAVETLYPLASIIVVAFNNLPLTKLCLTSILENTEYPAYEIIVVDNGSTDGTGAYLRSLTLEHAHIRVITRGHNTGFACATNRGLNLAGGDILVLLNNDTIVSPGWLTDLARHLEDHTIGMVGPVTNRAGNEAQIAVPYDTYGGFLEFARARGDALGCATTEVPMLTMFCVAMRRDAYREVGPLDEGYAVGMFEDDDYAMRMHAAGYRTVCAEGVHVHHLGGASLAAWSMTNDYGALFRKNCRRFEERWAVQWRPHARRDDLHYERVVDAVRRVVDAALPPDATVLVVSKGDDDLLALEGRRAWHFPQMEDGVFAGYYPADSAAAITHLEALRRKGASFLIIPDPARWWLDYYDGLREHLRRSGRLVVDEPGICQVFALREDDAPEGAAIASIPLSRGGA